MAADIAVTYRSIVLHIPATPLGLLPERWTMTTGATGATSASRRNN